MAKPAEKRSARPQRAPIAAEAFLRALADHGIDFFFANPGTDFPPIVEAFTRAERGNAKVPRPILVPHENLAVAMAHGAYLMTGRPQAVMVHVNVGTANTLNNLINLSRDRVPILLAAGRTPITEHGTFGSRSRPIHWAQEMFDQAGMLREVVKWDYELRVPEQVGDVVSRAHEVAMTSPRGPVYMVLPREPLAASLPEPPAVIKPRPIPPAAHPDPNVIATLADWIIAAEHPLILTAAAGAPDAVAALARCAERVALPVVTNNARVVTLPSQHPMNVGSEPGALFAEADLIIALESDAPWFPHLQQPPSGCRIVHIGEDPVFQRYPMRSFPSDLSIMAGTTNIMSALDAALAERWAKARPETKKQIADRRARLVELQQQRHAQLTRASAAPEKAITKAYLSRMIGAAVGSDAIIFNEYPLLLDHCRREQPNTFFGLSPAGGLGWGVGAALGAKLAAPDKFVIATVGDGAYMFTNPTVCHWVADAFKLPVLTIIFNNSRYGAVRGATLSMFKDSVAGENDGRFLADLDPSPDFAGIARAQGAHGERVERPDELERALADAKHAVLGGRPALLDVICPY
jgi:acetolactate synthase I/II/III large subunit